MVHEFLNNSFIDEFGSPDFNQTPITFDDISRPHKRPCYNPDLLPADISVAHENYFITLTTPSDSIDVLSSDDPNTLHVL